MQKRYTHGASSAKGLTVVFLTLLVLALPASRALGRTHAVLSGGLEKTLIGRPSQFLAAPNDRATGSARNISAAPAAAKAIDPDRRMPAAGPQTRTHRLRDRALVHRALASACAIRVVGVCAFDRRSHTRGPPPGLVRPRAGSGQ
jgi:hypothetical protein